VILSLEGQRPPTITSERKLQRTHLT
jgi:hypothetical protein